MRGREEGGSGARTKWKPVDARRVKRKKVKDAALFPQREKKARKGSPGSERGGVVKGARKTERSGKVLHAPRRCLEKKGVECLIGCRGGEGKFRKELNKKGGDEEALG